MQKAPTLTRGSCSACTFLYSQVGHCFLLSFTFPPQLLPFPLNCESADEPVTLWDLRSDPLMGNSSSHGHRKNRYGNSAVNNPSFPLPNYHAPPPFPFDKYGSSDPSLQTHNATPTMTSLPYGHVDSSLRALSGQAEGFGRFAVGGLYGPVYHVTTLAGNCRWRNCSPMFMLCLSELVAANLFDRSPELIILG